MAYLHFDNVAVAALTCAVPEFVQKQIIPEDGKLARRVRNFIRQTGISQRHISITEQTCTDLGYVASMKALENVGWEAGSLDALVFMSQTPDFNPGTGNAFVLHKHLGLPPSCFAFDVTLGCSSFPYGLATCCSFLQQPGINRVLMVSGDTQWPFAASKEALLAEMAFLFGEGTAALLLEKKQAPPIDIGLFADGSGYEHLFNPLAGCRNNWRRTNAYTLTSGLQIQSPPAKGAQYMDGPAISSFSTVAVPDTIKEFCQHIGAPAESFDGLVLHQANAQLLKSIAKRLGVPLERMPITIDRYGNTSGASPLLTISDAYGALDGKRLSLLISAFGIGLAWGVVRLEIEADVIEPVFETNFGFKEGFVEC